MLKRRITLTILAVGVLLGPLSLITLAQVEGCYASMEDNLLTLGNKRISRIFEWNKGDLKTISITDKKTGQALVMARPQSDVHLGALTDQVKSGQWAKHTVENAIANRHLQVEVTAVYEQIDVRRVFRIYPDCAVIACDYYVRAHKGEVPEFESKDTVLQSLRLPDAHWHYRAVEFFDRTDGINNLVRETSVLAYLSRTELRGNILFGQNAKHDTAIFMVKEAPCSFVQLHYPGYDYSVSTSEAQAVGMGICATDLSAGEWTRVYGLATGVSSKSEVAFLKSLRDYQKLRRRYVPERDDIIMMNTWGDRNRDARVGEAFVNKEVDACVRLGITHLQIDDGWQQGLSSNSAQSGGKLWDLWTEANWQPHADRFPNGFAPVVQHAKAQGVDLGLWFHPSNANDYEHWKRDARIVVNLYKNFKIRYFKIDGIKLPNKLSENNLRRFFDRIAQDSDGKIVVNLDATANNRTGYHYFYEYGNIFLENRYTDWGRYYPYWTLRNLWMLSKYVPAETLQIEFLNTWRNPDRYGEDDPLAPQQVPFGYAFAATMMAQPLAWFEGSGLPNEAFATGAVIKAYSQHQSRIHEGAILPIGKEPNGTSWTGFQSMRNEKRGYVLVFREYNPTGQGEMSLYDLASQSVTFEHVCGQGKDFRTKTGPKGEVTFRLPSKHSFALYQYRVNR
jgi:alpha-galactosidase